MDYQHILESIRRDITPLEHEGEQADYIPALAAVNPDQWGICIHTLKGEQYALGDWQVPFSLQSITKVFALAMALSLDGDELWQRMGKEPSGTAFNSLIQLELEHGKPRNPFINSGALVMAGSSSRTSAMRFAAAPAISLSMKIMVSIMRDMSICMM